MRFYRISALVLTGAVAVALTACEAKPDGAADSTDESASSDKAKDKDKDDKSDDSGGDGDGGSHADLGDVSAITLTKSGGISGMEETLEVDEKGKWSYTKARMAPQTGDLSDSELDELTSLASDSGITDVDKKSDKQCNDMQTYSLVVELEKGDDVKANSDQCGVSPNKQFDDIVNLLGEATPI